MMWCYCLTALHTGVGLLFDGSSVCPVVLRVLHHSGSVADDAAEESGAVSVPHCMYKCDKHTICSQTLSSIAQYIYRIQISLGNRIC